MNVTRTRKAIAALAGGAFLSTVAAGALAQAGAAELFGIEDMDGGYMLAAKSDAEGKCGEGKCGGDKDDAEGKCGEGKCGSAS